MGKAPAFQFYVRDWLADPQLRLASPSTRGIWIDLLCYMWESPERGQISAPKEKIATLVGADNGALDLFFTEAETLHFCDVSVTDNGWVTLRNRRMWREDKNRQNNRLRQQKLRDKRKSNVEITPPSSSSSSSSSSNPIEGVNTPSSVKCPHQKIIELYHEVFPSLPTVKSWPDQLKKILRKFWKEQPSLDWFRDYFNYIKDSDFLMGRKTDFQADLEWIIRPTNRTKILNGRYHKDSGNDKHVGIQRWLEIRRKRDEQEG